MVGLGNPGKKYAFTKHNVGFLSIDLLCEGQGLKAKHVKCQSLYTALQLEGREIVVLKPQTFMNLSGEAVRDMARAFSVAPENILVIYDDAALDAGRVRIRRGGSDGGHNGIKSIIYQLETDQFPRIKIGIGSPRREQTDLIDWVMSPIEADTMKAIRLAPEIVKTILSRGIEAAMQQYNNFTP